MPSASKATIRRILVALLVYNGEEFVPRCLASLRRLDREGHDVDVVILDDASPAPGWSERLSQLCEDAGFDYYGSPRNLGIPRNMNLGLLRALESGYDALVLLNSDTVAPSNLIAGLIHPLKSDPGISSVTAWSNAVSVYSLPMSHSERLADAPDLVDWISAQLADEFDGHVVEIPSAMGFCMAIPTRVISDVGLMDPLFGRGYSEEIDWSLRSHVRGYRSVLSPSCFVFHAGSGSTFLEGMIDAHQDFIDRRYPQYRSQVASFLANGVLDTLIERGCNRVVLTAARQNGYRIEATSLPRLVSDENVVRFMVGRQEGAPMLKAGFLGFESTFAIGAAGALRTAQDIVGGQPVEIRIRSDGQDATELARDARRQGAHQILSTSYPERVF